MVVNKKIKIEYIPIEKLRRWPRNPKDHDLGNLHQSINRFGFTNPMIIDERSGSLVCGHGRLEALLQKMKGGEEPPARVIQRNGTWLVPVIRGIEFNSEDEAGAYLLADNRLTEIGGWHEQELAQVLADMAVQGEEMLEGIGWDKDDIDNIIKSVSNPLFPEETKKTLAERFIIPPFTIFDTRQGYWQERKRAWLALGIHGELGRGECFTQDLIKRENPNFGRREQDKRSNLKNAPLKPPWAISTGTEFMAVGTSIFDPVLCEIAYRWFCPPGGHILDPFAGGSVRGIVAAWVDRKYTGVELRPEQVEANKLQANEIFARKIDPVGERCKSQWIIGDSARIKNLLTDKYDFIFSCPPYYDLEIYSDLEGELSAKKSYGDFLDSYRAIVADVVGLLKDNRFGCFVVGDIRDKKGFYRNFVSDTISAFQDARMKLYNEAILITAAGSLPIRITRAFEASRKLGKTHQNVLFFIKGDPKKATQAIGDVEYGYIEEKEDIN